MPVPSWILELRKKIGHDLILVPGVSAMIFNDRGEVLLQHRSDNGLWSTIGGVQEPGEDPADAVVREVFEETALKVEPIIVVGVYLSPTIAYPNGDQVQYITTQFICRPIDPTAKPKINDGESLELRYVPLDQLPGDLRPEAVLRIRHAAEMHRAGSKRARFKFSGRWYG